ncbi:MAG: hypothetical protein D4S01_01425 [Dehalococcoidia bacterium]|nr:MAG: hypothetical protein D4S01_01425 [Dehalococcoidia bacterium]
MIAAGIPIKAVQNMIDDDSDETKVVIRDFFNIVYQGIGSMRNWASLRRYISAMPSSGVLPADCEQLYYVEDDTDYLYFHGGVPLRYTRNRLYNYFRDIGVATPLLSGSDLATTINSTTVTSATGGFVSATHVGEYIRIGMQFGFYKIASVTDTNTIVLSDAVRIADLTDPSSAANLTGQYFEIRPTGTKKLLFTNDEGGAISSTTIKVWYTGVPLPVYNDYDMILLPGNCEAVRVKVCQMMDQTDKYANDALKKVPDYDEELEKMIALDPVPTIQRTPRDKYGQRMAFGARGTDNPGNYSSSGRRIV